MFNFTLAKRDFRYTPGYMLSAGAGLDLLNFLSVDAGYRIGMYNLTIYNETAQFYLATSIKFYPPCPLLLTFFHLPIPLPPNKE